MRKKQTTPLQARKNLLNVLFPPPCGEGQGGGVVRVMRNFLMLMLLLSGCTTAQIPGYISRNDHPYVRKIYGNFDKVVSSVDYVLKKQGWAITDEVDPAIYERDDQYDNNGYQNLLIMTDVRKHFLQLGSTRLNVFIHSIANITDVEIRFNSAHNDPIANKILDAVEQEINK